MQNQYLKKPLTRRTFWLGAIWQRRIEKQFVSTPHFFMSASAGDTQWVDAILHRKLDGVLEIGLHPASPQHAEEWRNHERLACLELGRKAQEDGVDLIGWKDL